MLYCCIITKTKRLLGLCTYVCGQLLGGVAAQLWDEQDGVAVRLHGGPSDGAQPVVGRVVQLGEVVAWRREERRDAPEESAWSAEVKCQS